MYNPLRSLRRRQKGIVRKQCTWRARAGFEQLEPRLTLSASADIEIHPIELPNTEGPHWEDRSGAAFFQGLVPEKPISPLKVMFLSANTESNPARRPPKFIQQNKATTEVAEMQAFKILAIIDTSQYDQSINDHQPLSISESPQTPEIFAATADPSPEPAYSQFDVRLIDEPPPSGASSSFAISPYVTQFSSQEADFQIWTEGNDSDSYLTYETPYVMDTYQMSLQSEDTSSDYYGIRGDSAEEEEEAVAISNLLQESLQAWEKELKAIDKVLSELTDVHMVFSKETKLESSQQTQQKSDDETTVNLNQETVAKQKDSSNDYDASLSRMVLLKPEGDPNLSAHHLTASVIDTLLEREVGANQVALPIGVQQRIDVGIHFQTENASGSTGATSATQMRSVVSTEKTAS